MGVGGGVVWRRVWAMPGYVDAAHNGQGYQSDLIRQVARMIYKAYKSQPGPQGVRAADDDIPKRNAVLIPKRNAVLFAPTDLKKLPTAFTWITLSSRAVPPGLGANETYPRNFHSALDTSAGCPSLQRPAYLRRMLHKHSGGTRMIHKHSGGRAGRTLRLATAA